MFQSGGGQPNDAVITLTTGIGLLTANAAMQVIQHEINEALGGGGQGSVLPSCPFAVPGGCYGPLDLYRYSAPGAPSFDPSAASAYLSVDGGLTSIASFNQSGSGDYGDFTDVPCLIQSFSACGFTSDSISDPNSPEYKMLEALGYDPSSFAVPGSVVGAGFPGLVFAASGLLAWWRQRRRRAVA
jgi:hypothetical protein